MRGRHRLAIAAVGIGSLAVGATAAALWSANGSGAARSRALSAQTATVNGASGTADLYPGFAGGDVFFTLTNANPFPLRFAVMTPGSIVSSDPSGCPASNIAVDAASGLSLDVAANATSTTLNIADVVSMAAAAPDACQGVTFTITLSLIGAQI